MILQIAKWNYDRENNNFDRELEERMLQEEALEFKEALEMFWEAISESLTKKAKVDLIDAYCDFIFVLYGSEYKMLGADVSIDLSRYHNQANYMLKVLETIGIDSRTLNKALGFVIEANKNKGKKKVSGKIQKGATWRDPKDDIFEMMFGEPL